MVAISFIIRHVSWFHTANHIVDMQKWIKMPTSHSFVFLFYAHRFLRCNRTHTYLIYLVQSKNWDGGLQERQTVIDAIAQIFPGSDVESHSKNAYPLRLKVHAKINGGEEGQAEKIKVWDGDQKRLFKKHLEMRAECVEEIKEALEKLRSDVKM